MKILGLDLGDASLGVAISDTSGWLARGVGTVRFDPGDFDTPLEYLANLIEEESVGTVVLGYPKRLDGTPGEQARKVERFKDLLAKRVDVRITLYDERLTSKQARDTLIEAGQPKRRRKQTLDKQAAVLLLQSYLDGGKEDDQDG